MATASVSPASPTRVEHEPPRLKATWQKYGAPVLVLLLATAVIVTLTRNWNAWEGSGASKLRMTLLYAAISRLGQRRGT
jgi:cytochrome c-type biogenesis protein CcmH/NrfF